MNGFVKDAQILSQKKKQSPPDAALFLRGLYGGGAERVLLTLAQGFVERGLKVDLVLARAEGPYLEQVHPKVRIVDLQAQWMPSSLPKLVKYLRQAQPLNLLAALHYPCEIALWARQLAGGSTRIIVSEHNTLSLEAARIPQLSVQLTPLAARLFYPWADAIVAVSQGVATDLSQIARLRADRLQVVYNPVITPELFSLAQEPVEHPWFQPGAPPVILGVGRLHPQKDFPTLIRAFDRVRQIRPARLIILGDGPERAKLTALIAELGLNDDVILPGFVQNPYAYMSKANVLVLSSLYEGLPTVLIEALAVGTPVVSTNCESGPAEILAQGKYGHLTPVGDSEAIAAAISSVLAGHYPIVEPHWLEQFTLEISIQKYLAVLNL